MSKYDLDISELTDDPFCNGVLNSIISSASEPCKNCRGTGVVASGLREHPQKACSECGGIGSSDELTTSGAKAVLCLVEIMENDQRASDLLRELPVETAALLLIRAVDAGWPLEGGEERGTDKGGSE